MEENIFSEPVNLDCFDNFFKSVMEWELFKPNVDKLLGELVIFQNHERLENDIEKLKKMNARTANMIRSLEERKKLEQKKREFIKEENEKNELFKAKTREDITAYLNLDEETSVTDFLFEESLNSLQTLELQFFESTQKRLQLLDSLSL